ncbi:MAG TPA: GSCFA domain-containing protein [Pseudolabrys sp.]|nr:GSCFA domain-containing protein [Pseudolabrys sp.]
MGERIAAEVARQRNITNKAYRWLGRDEPNRLEPECWPVMKPSFKLRPGAKIFTIGSCFARNIESHLADQGFDIPMKRFDFGSRSGADAGGYMNKYTPAAIYQELRWAYDIMTRDGVVREEDVKPLFVEREDGHVYDLHTHSQKSETFETALERRQGIYQTFKEAFSSEAVVITLGMVETWWDEQSQLYVHTMPYLLTRNAMPRFRFERMNFMDCYQYLNKTLDLLDSTGRKNYLITTSPVALARTFSEDDILIANTYSKSVLRAVAGQVVEERDNVDYFPSFESVMLTKQGYVWEDDLAHVSYNFVGRIMQRVSQFYVDASAQPAQAGGDVTGPHADAELLFTGVMQYGDLPKAGEIFQSLKFDPLTSKNVLFHTQAARLLMKQDKREGALAHARKAVTTLSTFKREQVLAGEVLRWAGALDESNDFLTRMFDSVADTPEPLLQILRVARQYLAPQETLDWSKRYFKAGLAYAATEILNADLQLELGLKSEAVESFRKAIALDPENHQPYVRLGNLLIDMQRPAEAVEPFQKAAGLDPANFQLRRRLAFVLMETGRIKEAVTQFGEAARLAPDDAKAHASYARALRKVGESEKALGEFKIAQRLDPNDASIDNIIAQLEKQVGDGASMAAAR